MMQKHEKESNPPNVTNVSVNRINELVIETLRGDNQNFTIHQILNSTRNQADRTMVIKNQKKMEFRFIFSAQMYKKLLSSIEIIRKVITAEVSLSMNFIHMDAGGDVVLRSSNGSDIKFTPEQVMNACFSAKDQTLLISDGRLISGYQLSDEAAIALIKILKKLRGEEARSEKEKGTKYQHPVKSARVINRNLLLYVPGTPNADTHTIYGTHYESCKLEGDILTYENSKGVVREYVIPEHYIDVVKAFVEGRVDN